MDYDNTLEYLKNYYADLLIVQYHDKPKAIATIKLLTLLIYANMILFRIRDAFDVKTAIGNQLDIIGKWVGLSRFYGGQAFDYRPWFSLLDWNTTGNQFQGGFSTFENFNTLFGGFLTYEDIEPTNNRLIDSDYRTFIGLKIIYNNINHVAKEIDTNIWNFFNQTVYTTWDFKKVTYHHPPDMYRTLRIALDLGILPAPTGTQIVLQEI